MQVTLIQKPLLNKCSISTPRWRSIERHRLQAVDLNVFESGIPTVIGGGLAVLGISAAAYIISDPQKRRELQMEQTGGSEKDSIREYFNGDGFSRWNKIYGTTDDISSVQKDIRDGHAITIDKTLSWLCDSENLTDKTICDAGCGTGSLAIPLALQGAAVTATDISQSMVEEAQRRYQEAFKSSSDTQSTEPQFATMDLESLTGKFDIVTCLDVMIHYPQDKADEMISHLASLSTNRLIISFAPKTIFYSLLKRVGEFFPGPSKATRAYLHAEEDVESSLIKAGFKITNRDMTATNFYFSRLLEAVRV